MNDQLTDILYNEICKIPLIDPHSHIDPHQPTSKTLDDILNYHYYTELSHSAGMSHEPLGDNVEPRERVRTLLAYLGQIDNTAQYSWFVQIVRAFLDFEGDRPAADDCDALFDASAKRMAQDDWEQQVFDKTNLEQVFLTNNFDDPLEGFDTKRYVPCLRADDLVFHLHQKDVRTRLARATNVEVGDTASLRQAIGKLFQHFTSSGAKACAISLPPSFAPVPVETSDLDRALKDWDDENMVAVRAAGVFWMLAEHCREFGLPFDLMIGVNRRVYRNGVPQGQDLFDQRTSLIQFAELFNKFVDVTFPISVLSSGQNQELVSYSWIFPNVATNGHWWYSNIPAYIESDCKARLQAVPKTKQIGYYSDAYKLEFVLPKYDMYRKILAGVLANDFVKTKTYTETEAIELAKLLLRENTRRIFHV